MVVTAPQRGQLGKVNGFQLLKFLGKGTFGAVYQARREADGKVYAIKKVDTRRMTTKERAEAVNEIRVLASVHGEHVITFYEAFVENDVLYIVTEFAGNGDLLQFLKNKRRAGHLPEQTVWSFFIQMAMGVKAMHENNILHRDLKAANVFLCSNSYLKLGDLGVAKVLKHETALASTQVGTPYYVAPEVWRNKAYNSKCDMWSLGCLLYELCTFRPPFEAESMEGLARKVMKGRYEQIPNFYSQALRTTLAKLLVVEPNYRASVQEILSSEAVLSRMADVASAVSSQAGPSHQEGLDIVSTIQVPRRFNDLTKNLPPSRYDTKVSPTGLSPPSDVAASRQVPPPRGLNAPPGIDPLLRNPAESKPPSEAGEVARYNRHAGNGNTVAKAVESAQHPRQGGGGGGIKLPPGRHRVSADDATGSVLSQQHGAGPHPLQYGQVYQPPQKLKLPQVPGAQPPPTPSQGSQAGSYMPRAAVPRYMQPASQNSQPTREIRMVYHQPNGNGDSRLSIFRGQHGGQQSRGLGAYFNPITHTPMSSGLSNARVHSRPPHANAAQGANQYPPSMASQYSAQRRRVTPSHWY